MEEKTNARSTRSKSSKTLSESGEEIKQDLPTMEDLTMNDDAIGRSSFLLMNNGLQDERDPIMVGILEEELRLFNELNESEPEPLWSSYIKKRGIL